MSKITEKQEPDALPHANIYACFLILFVLSLFASTLLYEASLITGYSRYNLVKTTTLKSQKIYMPPKPIFDFYKQTDYKITFKINNEHYNDLNVTTCDALTNVKYSIGSSHNIYLDETTIKYTSGEYYDAKLDLSYKNSLCEIKKSYGYTCFILFIIFITVIIPGIFIISLLLYECSNCIKIRSDGYAKVPKSETSDIEMQ